MRWVTEWLTLRHSAWAPKVIFSSHYRLLNNVWTHFRSNRERSFISLQASFKSVAFEFLYRNYGIVLKRRMEVLLFEINISFLQSFPNFSVFTKKIIFSSSVELSYLMLNFASFNVINIGSFVAFLFVILDWCFCFHFRYFLLLLFNFFLYNWFFWFLSAK